MRQLRLRLLRRWARRRPIRAPLDRLLASDLLRGSIAFDDVEFVCLDIETTGLDSDTAEPVSVGWVLVRNGRVDLRSAQAFLIKPNAEVGASATVHGLTDTIVRAGNDRGSAMDEIVEALVGRVLVVHHAGLDKALLDRLCLARYGARLLVPVVDTLAQERVRRQRQHHVSAPGSLRLADLRGAYALPRYRAHDSLVDAIATAELLIAMRKHYHWERLDDLPS